jgi:selenocysteine lyase/cysteine desulfurase
VAPITGPAQAAIDAWSAEAAAGRQESEAIWKRVAQTRAVAARFLGCEAEEVALLGPTALGLGLVALGLDWKSGDEVIFDPLDYPANVYPWKELERKGVRAVAIPRNPGEPISWETIRPLVSGRTRLVSLATAHYLSGHLPELSVIGPELKKKNILLNLDAIQTLGVLPTAWAEADFLAADAHKVRKRGWDRLRPPLLGSWNVVSPEFLAQPEIEFEAGGRRYEPGSLNLPGIEGMRASLELLDSIGLPEISSHALALARQIREGARQAGFTVYGGEGEERVITSLVPPPQGWEKIRPRMEAAKIRVSWRKEHGGKTLLRVAPHLSNTAEEIGEFLGLLKN